MRKIQVLMLALFSVLAFGALSAASAFAETEFLHNGLQIPVEEQVPVRSETMENLLLEDTKGGVFNEKVDVLCSGLDEGTIGRTLGFITKITDLLGNAPPVLCETDAGICPDPQATPLNLPWHFELVLNADGTLLVRLLNDEPTKIPAYELNCEGVKDICEAETGEANMPDLDVFNDVNDLLLEFLPLPKGKCSRGGAGAAITESGDLLIVAVDGLPLEVMS